eukprot:scaffold39311_cov32-Tisochrysis_lutea.AAC.5
MVCPFVRLGLVTEEVISNPAFPEGTQLLRREGHRWLSRRLGTLAGERGGDRVGAKAVSLFETARGGAPAASAARDTSGDRGERRPGRAYRLPLTGRKWPQRAPSQGAVDQNRVVQGVGTANRFPVEYGDSLRENGTWHMEGLVQQKLRQRPYPYTHDATPPRLDRSLNQRGLHSLQ